MSDLINREYERWRALATWDPDLVLELSEMENDPAKIEDSFFKALEFGTGGLRGVLGAGTNRMNRCYTPCQKIFEYICSMLELMPEIDRCDPDHTDIKTRFLESVLLLLYKTVDHEPKSAYKNDTDMQKALIYINAHFKENPSLEEMASILHLNKRYFCTKFKEYTGETYKNYLRRKKLRYARWLVLATSLPMIEVAAQSGYPTQTHFNHEFKEFYGITPSEYRQQATK